MNANVVIGVAVFIVAAVAFAALWGRILGRGYLAPVVAAACTAAVVLASDYVATGEMNAAAVPLFAALFVVALIIAIAVQYSRRLRGSRARNDA